VPIISDCYGEKVLKLINKNHKYHRKSGLALLALGYIIVHVWFSDKSTHKKNLNTFDVHFRPANTAMSRVDVQQLDAAIISIYDQCL